MATPKATPVSSFGPQMLALLLKGSNESVQIELPSYTRARSLMTRLHTLRSAMRRERHPMAEHVARAKISILFGKAAGYPALTPEQQYRDSGHTWHPRDRSVPAKLWVRPADSEFEQALSNAGIDIKPSEATEQVLREPLPASSQDEMDALISGLMKPTDEGSKP